MEPEWDHKAALKSHWEDLKRRFYASTPDLTDWEVFEEYHTISNMKSGMAITANVERWNRNAKADSPQSD